ncbi:MAG: Gfo/Idh/MocA family oxidoreductase [Nitrospira sp.]|nr:MAG: Gfo/Idh/MocA family oxidoreductase [Nitrospira sp.]
MSRSGKGAGRVRVGLIGYGYWGPNLLRNFLKNPECEVVAVADCDENRLAGAARLYPGLRTVRSADEVLADKGIDAVVISTPISTHFDLASRALNNGKHVLVEKPMAGTVTHAERLVALAERRQLTLMVDHTFVYSGAVKTIKGLVQSGDVGDVYYYDSVRVNLGLFQQDTNVLWDLAPHDFSIMSHVLGARPTTMWAVGARLPHSKGWKTESLAYVTIEFSDGMLAHFHLNWLSPVKVRRTLIGGSKRMIVYDHLDPDNQVKVFDKGVEMHSEAERYQLLVQYRAGDMWAPKVDQTEALETACGHFLTCVATGAKPLSDGQAGLENVQLLAAADRSLSRKGKAIKL